jgi:hypothetical protein
MEKAVYFSVSWRDAAEFTNKLKQSGLRYSIEQFPGSKSLAFVFPQVSMSQYVYLYVLFGSDGIDYQRKKSSERRNFWARWRSDG